MSNSSSCSSYSCACISLLALQLGDTFYKGASCRPSIHAIAESPRARCDSQISDVLTSCARPCDACRWTPASRLDTWTRARLCAWQGVHAGWGLPRSPFHSSYSSICKCFCDDGRAPHTCFGCWMWSGKDCTGRNRRHRQHSLAISAAHSGAEMNRDNYNKSENNAQKSMPNFIFKIMIIRYVN